MVAIGMGEASVYPAAHDLLSGMPNAPPLSPGKATEDFIEILITNRARVT